MDSRSQLSVRCLQGQGIMLTTPNIADGMPNSIHVSLGDDTIKSCFLYCAVFPEDKSINRSKLIDYWIGEGFISLSDFNDIDEARNYGYDVIGELKGACLLESGVTVFEETRVKMHDTIRDMALWITRECGSSKRDKLLTIYTFDGMSERLWYNAERICLSIRRDDETIQVPTLKSPNLLTLIHIRTWRKGDLTHSEMQTFPTSITGLLELRYLSLSYTDIKELPEELGKLVNLNYLNLSHMNCLEKIPSGVIGSLLELRVLNLFQSREVDWDLDEVYRLKHLNDVEISIKTQHNLNKLLSNTNLQMCTRGLILQSEDEPFLFANQKKKQSVRLLEEANMGIEQQQHLGSSCFQILSLIIIWNCNGFKDLTWVGYMPNLKTLEVLFCEELEEIVVVDDDFGGGSTGRGGGDETILTTKMRKVVDIFKSLKTLRLWDLPKLKSICRNAALAFPCLVSMCVYNCPQLKKLPLDSGSNVNNTLREIRGGPKWWSELQWEEEEHNNNNNSSSNELLKSKFLPYFVEL